MPKRPITDEELQQYLITGEKPKDATAVSALKDYLGVSEDEAPLPDVGTVGQQFPEPKSLEMPKVEEIQPPSINSSEAFDSALKAKKPELFKNQFEGMSPEEADERIMAGETPEARASAERQKAISQEKGLPIGQVMSPQEFDDNLAFKKPELFDNPYLGMPAEKADEMIMAGQLPERLVAEPPEMPEPIDVPHAQAQAQAKEEHVDIPKEGHTNDLLKATDNQKQEEKIADEKLAQTNPIEYIKKKYGLEMPSGLEELKAAQKQANFDRALASAGESFMRAGYGFKNIAMPESESKYYKEQLEAAERPVAQVKERREAAQKNIDTFGKVFDLATQDFDFERKQRLTNPNTAESRAVGKLMASFLPADLQYLKDDPDFKKLSAMDQKEFIEKALEKRMSLDAMQAAREQTAAYREAQLELQKQKLEKGAEAKPSVGEAQTDKEFAKKYSTWVAEKGSLSADKSLANLEASINEMKALEKKGVTGGMGGAFYSVMPESLKSAVNEKIGRIDSNLRSAVVDTLRPLLGAQFAAVEGERIMKQTFDANQPMSENIRRAKLVLADLKNQVDSRKRAVQHWESKGQTLKGYEAFPEQTKAAPAESSSKSVTIRRKSDGVKKTLPAEKAQKYLSDPNFEEVK